MPAAPSSSTASWPALTAAPKVITPDRPSCPAPNSRARNRPTRRRRPIARRWPRSIAIASRNYQDKRFADLSEAQQDELLKSIEDGRTKLEGVDGQSFFATVIKDVQEGFFADPLYGGNRDMVGWKMIGYPGARYNYLDWVERHNERFPLPPVSLIGRADWSPKT